jgi:hypothetical protein
MRLSHDSALRLVVLFLLSVWPASAPADQTPEGWFLAGSHPQDYGAGTTSSVSQEGKASAYLASKTPQPEGFGTLMQTFGADSYRGGRLRMTGFVKAETVDGWAGLWMRVDGPQQQSLGFDNMQDRPIKGTGDWQRCHVVLDVPQESTQIAFGILLNGGGKVYLDNVAFEVVPSSVPTTDLRKKSLQSVPKNLNFEK